MWRQTGLFKDPASDMAKLQPQQPIHLPRNPCETHNNPAPPHNPPPLIVQEVNALNRLALEGVLAVIESISRRCGPSSKPPSSSQQLGFWVQQAAGGGGGASPPLPLSGPHSGGLSASLGGSDPSRRGSVSDSDSDQEYIPAFGGRGAVHGGGGAPFGGSGGGGAAGELEWLERARARTAEVLQERKKMKRRLGLAARKFNSGTKGWLEYAQVCRKKRWSGVVLGVLVIPVGLSLCRERWGTDKAVLLRRAIHRWVAARAAAGSRICCYRSVSCCLVLRHTYHAHAVSTTFRIQHGVGIGNHPRVVRVASGTRADSYPQDGGGDGRFPEGHSAAGQEHARGVPQQGAGGQVPVQRAGMYVPIFVSKSSSSSVPERYVRDRHFLDNPGV